jgi:hypothetical protein
VLTIGNTISLPEGNTPLIVHETKAAIQKVYEYVTKADRAVPAREIVSALPECSRSAVTFALTRLVREGDLQRSGRGRYTSTGSDDPTVIAPEDDDYLFDVFERIRPVLPFADLAFLYEVVEAMRRLTPEAFRSARSRSQRRTPKIGE